MRGVCICGVRRSATARTEPGLYVLLTESHTLGATVALHTNCTQLDAQYYKDASTFTCISNPSIQIPFARINDDYCDCPDGSDEPGTSACSHLSPLSPQTPADTTPNAADTTPALPGFYCQNKGHVPSYVPFTSVNDGVCDYDLCCDGSEEWEGAGGVRCEDKCKEIGKEWRRKDEARQKSLGNAAKKRKELVTQAQRLKKEVEDRVKTIQTQIEGAELKVKQMEREVADLEQKEKSKVVQATSGQKGGGKLGILSDLAKRRIDELREHLGQVRMERNEYSRRVYELEEILTTFKEEYNPNFNDEGVKRAVRAWEDYAAQKDGDDASQEAEEDLNQILRPDNANGLDWSQFEEDDSSDTDVCKYCSNHPNHGRITLLLIHDSVRFRELPTAVGTRLAGPQATRSESRID